MNRHAKASTNNGISTALQQAQALVAPKPQSTHGGEMENAEWWERHSSLLRQARMEWGRRDEDIYEWESYMNTPFLQEPVLRALNSKDVTQLKSLVSPTNIEGVYQVQLFTQAWVYRFLRELEYQESAKIPTRRPNGMNRYGAMLQEFGMADLFQEFSKHLMRPLAQTLFPRNVSIVDGDLEDNYPFVVRYEPMKDVDLGEHADSSLVTMNVCLEIPPPYNKSPLYFKGFRNSHAPPTFLNIEQNPGMALIHLGQHVHGVSNVHGRRSNMILWMFGEYGYVRVVPYEEEETKQNLKQWMKRDGWKES